MTPYFTIAICTFNRAEVLPRSIAAASAQRPIPGGFEVLVVDNNSTDDTTRLLEISRAGLPMLRVVRESQQGLSHARNRAIAEAHGKWIVFVDDDAELDPGYLQGLSTLLSEEKGVGAAGGPIEVGWLSPVPSWYEPALDLCFNHLYLGSYRMELRYPRMLYGTNMAFPVALLRRLGGFDAGLGRVGRHLAAGEDGEVLLRVERRAQRRILWDPALRVRHLIEPGRLTVGGLLKQAEGGGRSQARLERAWRIRTGLWNALAGLAESAVRVLLRRSRGPVFERYIRAAHTGYLRGYFGGK